MVYAPGEVRAVVWRQLPRNSAIAWHQIADLRLVFRNNEPLRGLHGVRSSDDGSSGKGRRIDRRIGTALNPSISGERL